MCVKAGKRCVDCLPSRNDHCSNPNNNRISSPLLLPNSSEALESLQTPPVIASCLYSCPCGIEDPTQPLIRCHGPGKKLFHYNCSGITSQEEQDDWQCLQCSIFQSQNTKTIRHILKGADIQVALGLAQLLEACSNESGSIAAWRRLFSFPANTLAPPSALQHHHQN